jgi:hypothetical protein
MKVTVELHNGDKRTYEQASHVADKDKYSVYIYDAENNILAILSKGDIKSLLTDVTPE